MRKGMISLSAALLFANAYASDGFQALKQVNNRIIVKYKNPQKAFLLKYNIAKLINMPTKNITPMASGAYVIQLDSKNIAPIDIDKTLISLNKRPDVVYAVKDRIGYFKPVANKPTGGNKTINLGHQLQWDEFKAPQGVMLETKAGMRDGAMKYTTGNTSGKPVVVAVLDTGIEKNPNLVDNILKNDDGTLFGWNFASNNNNLRDETGSFHGTHVAGTVAAYGSTVLGMGESLKILPIKIPNASGMFYESAVINGIVWSVGGDVPGAPKNTHPAKVLNMSFGVDEYPGKEKTVCDPALQDAVNFAKSQGAVIVVAAGNDNRYEEYKAPAVCQGTVRVASTGPQGLRAYYSNYGPGTTLAAPGGDFRYGTTGGILSTVKPGRGFRSSGFDFFQGTSMAAPHVAGIAGLIFAAGELRGDLTPTMVEEIMTTTTHNFGKSSDSDDSCVGRKSCGHGIIDANNAVKATLAGFTHFYTGPKVKANACGRNVAKVDGVWERVSQAIACNDSQFNPSRIAKEGDDIYAYVAGQKYRFNANHKSCDVVGFDGVACF